MENNNNNSLLKENLIYDFFYSSFDYIIQERRCIYDNINSNDYGPYFKQSLKSLRNDIYKPYILDIYIIDKSNNNYILLERWKIYLNKIDSNNNNKRTNNSYSKVMTLLKCLQCFIRLLPGFNLINTSIKLPILNFQIYEYKNSYPSSFITTKDIKSYKFNSITVPSGILNVSVKFLSSKLLMVALSN